jgi:hypothetical protein
VEVVAKPIDDENDYELVQERAMSIPDLEDVAADDADGPWMSQSEIRAASRVGAFDLKYKAICVSCHRTLAVGTRVVGRKLDNVWIIEEMGECPGRQPKAFGE